MRSERSPGRRGGVLVIDDSSPDGTGELADRLAGEIANVSVLHRERKEGLGPAYIAGFHRALADGADLVLEMDCDFSHDPADVPRLLAAAEDADLVLGSRYVDGGGVRNWGASDGSSRRGSTYARVILGTVGCATSPAGSSASAERCWRRSRSTGSTPRVTPSRSRPPTAPSVPASGSSRCRSSSSTARRGHSKMSRGDRARGRLAACRSCGSRALFGRL